MKFELVDSEFLEALRIVGVSGEGWTRRRFIGLL
jgi:hypothetical protein